MQAGDGIEGLKVFDAEQPDVVITDWRLPDGNGLDLAEGLRSDLPGSAVAVCTAHDTPEYREAARRRGAAAFFAKHHMDWRAVERFAQRASRWREREADESRGG